MVFQWFRCPCTIFEPRTHWCRTKCRWWGRLSGARKWNDGNQSICQPMETNGKEETRNLPRQRKRHCIHRGRSNDRWSRSTKRQRLPLATQQPWCDRSIPENEPTSSRMNTNRFHNRCQELTKMVFEMMPPVLHENKHETNRMAVPIKNVTAIK